MSEPAPVRCRHPTFNESVITEDLERRAVIAIARQTQVDARKMCVRKRGQTIEPRARHVAFWTFGPASKYVGVKANQSFPVSGNKICMNVFRSDWHCLLLG